MERAEGVLSLTNGLCSWQVLDLAEMEQLAQKRIYLNETLINRIEAEDDWCQPGPPFFHLRNRRFWKHKPRIGREERYAKLKTSRGGMETIHDNYAYRVISDSAGRNERRRFIASLLNNEIADRNYRLEFEKVEAKIAECL